MTDELEGDIVSFRSKKDIIKDKISNNKLSKPSLPNSPSQSSNPDLIPEDIIRKSSFQNRHTTLQDNNIEKENGGKCEITGEIIPYKKPVGIPTEGGGPSPGLPSEPPPTDLSAIAKILEEHHTMLQQIANIEGDLKDFLMGYSATGTYFELRTATTVSTLNQPATPETITDGSIPGYDPIDINIQKQGQNAKKLWIINDGPPAPGVGDNLYVITSSDGKTFSPEFLMIVGETRLVNNVYEIRIRGPRANNAVRFTEREAIVPYVTTVSNTLTPVSNRTSFTARRIGPLVGASTLPSIVIPDSFSIVIRAWVDNPGNSRVYVAGPEPIPGPATTNVGNPTNRITLAPGDVVKYIISNANLVAVLGSIDNLLYVDITVEI